MKGDTLPLQFHWINQPADDRISNTKDISTGELRQELVLLWEFVRLRATGLIIIHLEDPSKRSLLTRITQEYIPCRTMSLPLTSPQ